MTQSQPGEWVVFISHSSTDTWVANQIAKEIEACKAATFLDEANVQVGEDFENRILDEITRADELLVLFTPWSINRPYVWAEIGAAWVRRIPIIGILHGLTANNLVSNADIPLLIKRRDFLELNEIDTYFDQLRTRILT